ncbi:hypothetical protein RD792_013382 [Penstemon davidsonii]|uniref:Uncharacterized protein n=1 Tax=Penstemon davidsonii TaxID=160366 RepID=A0ABR0CUW0_9LAMI|nr:hypothetical protein RD792_013382 [Penstemon davidsonii]
MACFSLMTSTISSICLTSFLLFFLLKTTASQSIVKTLPGFDGELPFKLETGYMSVGKNDEVQIFYYFFESERDPQNDPLVLSLTGGPGCSSLYAIAFEFGPINFDFSTYGSSLPSLVLNSYSWTKMANMIFVDWPVGAGFSYTTNPESYYTSDSKSPKDVYKFLQKGYFVGNPITDVYLVKNEKVPYAHNMGLISDEYFKLARCSCNGEYVIPDLNNVQCRYALELINEEQYYMISETWANNPYVREALHIREGTKGEWVRYNKSVAYAVDVASSAEYHLLLSKQGYRGLVYSGDHDMEAPYSSTLKWIRSLNLTLDDDWRQWKVDKQIAGYISLGRNDEVNFYSTSCYFFESERDPEKDPLVVSRP